jgi:hypothetical protein
VRSWAYSANISGFSKNLNGSTAPEQSEAASGNYDRHQSGRIFAAAEVNTLLVDCDPQSNNQRIFGPVRDPSGSLPIIY